VVSVSSLHIECTSYLWYTSLTESLTYVMLRSSVNLLQCCRSYWI